MDAYGMNIIGAAEPLTPDEAMLASVIHGFETGQFGAEIVGQAFPLATRVMARAPSRPVASTLAQRYSAAAARAMPMLGNLNFMRPQQQGFGAPLAVPTATPMSPSGALVAPVGLGPIREVSQGIDSGIALIAGGASFSITVNVTMAFRPTRLMVGPAIAPLWVVDNLRVGPDSLFLGAPGSQPAENYLPGAVTASALKRKTAQGGTPVIIDVTNIDAVPHRFRASIFGEAADAAQC